MQLYMTTDGVVINTDRLVSAPPKIEVVKNRRIVAPTNIQQSPILLIERKALFNYRARMDGQKESINLCNVELILTNQSLTLPTDSDSLREFFETAELVSDVEDKVKSRIVKRLRAIRKYHKAAQSSNLSLTTPSAVGLPETGTLSAEAASALSHSENSKIAEYVAWLEHALGTTVDEYKSLPELVASLDQQSVDIIAQNLEREFNYTMGFAVPQEEAGPIDNGEAQRNVATN